MPIVLIGHVFAPFPFNRFREHLFTTLLSFNPGISGDEIVIENCIEAPQLHEIKWADW